MPRHLPVAAVAIVLGCGSPVTGPLTPARLSITVTTAGLDQAPGAPDNRLARVTVRHEGGRTVALSGCPRPPAVQIERREDGAWHDAGSYGLYCLAIHSSKSVALAAGGQVELVVAPGVAGVYRFVVPIGPNQGAPEFDLRSAAVDFR